MLSGSYSLGHTAEEEEWVSGFWMLHKIRICVVHRCYCFPCQATPAAAVDADFAFALDDNFILNRVIMKE